MIIDIVYGFLGSGKTTFITHVLQTWGKGERIVVLVNEFGEIGIDGSILSGYGQEVVEMPSGCICCSLQTDFKRQLLEIYSQFKPDRVIIEPSGVASITQIQTVISLEAIANLVRMVHNIIIVDAATFLEFYKANMYFFDTQINNADLAILNKSDLVDKRKLTVLSNAITSIRPDLYVITTSHCKIDWREYHSILNASRRPKPLLERSQVITSSFPIISEGENGHHHFEGEEVGLGYESFGRDLGKDTFRYACLSELFSEMLESRSDWGLVVRAKGIFKTEMGWNLFEIASGNCSEQLVRSSDSSKVSVIGRQLKHEELLNAIEKCKQTN